MSAPTAATSEQILLTRWRRDYRLSLVLFATGVVLVVAAATFNFWANSAWNYSPPLWVGVTLYATGTAGGMLLLLAGTVAYFHWKGLQMSKVTP